MHILSTPHHMPKVCRSSRVQQTQHMKCINPFIHPHIVDRIGGNSPSPQIFNLFFFQVELKIEKIFFEQ